MSAYDKVTSKYISESVSMGVDKNPETAMLKCITEFCERKFLRQSTSPEAFVTNRTDGFAAFPTLIGKEKSQILARNNAYNEAVERYVWSAWWDECSTDFSIETADDIEEYDQLASDFSLESLHRITVSPMNSNVSLTILLAKILGRGYVCGGAAGTAEQKIETISRSFGELLRHLLTVNRMKESSDLSSMSFYEKRLWMFYSGIWNYLVYERLNRKGTQRLELPHLEIDAKIAHPLQEIISIHRCYFLNQRPFIGGKIDRLCI